MKNLDTPHPFKQPKLTASQIPDGWVPLPTFNPLLPYDNFKYFKDGDRVMSNEPITRLGTVTILKNLVSGKDEYITLKVTWDDGATSNRYPYQLVRIGRDDTEF